MTERALVNRPLRGPRDLVGEQVFCEEWRKLAGEYEAAAEDGRPNALLRDILSAICSRVSQRHATVAATFITWLGTNCGHGYLTMAERLEKATGGYGRGYVAQLAIENLQQRHINEGFNLAEHLLAGDDCWVPEGTNGGRRLAKVPRLTADDYHVLAHVALWLGTVEGRSFLDRCDREILRRQKDEWRKELKRQNPALAAQLAEIERNEA